MFVAMLSSAVLSYCPFPYAQNRSVTIEFETGSAKLSAAAADTMRSLLSADVGNPRAEFHVRLFYPYGAPENGDPRQALAEEQARQTKATAAALGFSVTQIEARISAIGFAWRDNHDNYAVPFDAADLDRMEVSFRVRTACHPVEQHQDNDGPFVR
ncbi:hypothetical protein [Brevundimonas vesicularis]|uniref:hypothetical protein n=1 Tax=Brevundimonas vesicularis TaxID=41276 RepID=UPI00384CF578